jgi:CRP/FNR family transcriptional regulator
MIDLSGIKLFSAIPEAERAELEPYLIEQSFDKRALIFNEGDPSDWFWIVASGKVKITKISQDGKEIILEIIHARDMFGAVAVLRHMPYPANAVAMEPTTTLKISRTNFMRVVDRFPEIMQMLFESLGTRLKDSHETMRNIALEKVGSRIAALLLKLAEQAGTKTASGTRLNIRLTKQDIAEMVGTTVETSIRTMSRFRKDGLIEEVEGHIVILDPDGLALV